MSRNDSFHSLINMEKTKINPRRRIRRTNSKWKTWWVIERRVKPIRSFLCSFSRLIVFLQIDFSFPKTTGKQIELLDSLRNQSRNPKEVALLPSNRNSTHSFVVQEVHSLLREKESVEWSSSSLEKQTNGEKIFARNLTGHQRHRLATKFSNWIDSFLYEKNVSFVREAIKKVDGSIEFELCLNSNCSQEDQREI